MDRTRDNNLEDPTAPGARTMGDAATAAAQRVGERLEQGRAALAEMSEAVADRTRDCMRSTDIYVRDNPWQAVGIAAGLGLIIGLLISRR